MAAAVVQERMFFRAVAQFIDHGLRDHRAGAKEEAGALDRVDLARGVVDFEAERMRERVVERKTRPSADVNLLVLSIHRVFRQRLQMLPAAQGAEPSNVGAIMTARSLPSPSPNTVRSAWVGRSFLRFAM